MKKSSLVTTFSVCGLTLLLCGCGPELAQVEYGAEEASWSKAIGESYPGYRNPRTAPPAIKDSVSPRLIQAEEAKADAEKSSADAVGDIVVEETVIPAPADDAAAPVVKEETKSAEEVKTDAKDEVKTDAKSEAKADAADAVTTTVYEVKSGDTLGAIAKKYYGDAAKYDIIIKANSIKDPKKIQVGTKLLIPQL